MSLRQRRITYSRFLKFVPRNLIFGRPLTILQGLRKYDGLAHLWPGAVSVPRSRTSSILNITNDYLNNAR